MSLQKMPDCVYCPRCSSACLEDAQNCAQCAKCFFAFCSLCNESWHPGIEVPPLHAEPFVRHRKLATTHDAFLDPGQGCDTTYVMLSSTVQGVTREPV